MVWYHIEKDIIFMNGNLDALFFSLIDLGFYYPDLDWDDVELLGEL